MSRVVKDPEVRKQEIISAAEKLFNRDGYNSTAVEAIIKEAGIAKGTFYYYFRSKQDILKAIVELISGDIQEHFKQILEMKDKTAIEKLEMMLRGPQKKQKTKDSVMDMVNKPENRELQEYLNIQSVEMIAPLIARAIEQGNKEGVFDAGTPLETSQLILAGSQFVLDSGLFDWSDQKQAELLKASQALFENAIGARPGSLSFISNI